VQSTSSYPSFSVYIHKEARKTATGNDDGCAPDNMVITPSITNDTFFSLSLFLFSRLLLPISSYTTKAKKKKIIWKKWHENLPISTSEDCLVINIPKFPSCVTKQKSKYDQDTWKKESEKERQKRMNK